MFQISTHHFPSRVVPATVNEQIPKDWSSNVDQLITIHLDSLFLICYDFNHHFASWWGVDSATTSHGIAAKAFCDALGLTHSPNFPTRISTAGMSSVMDLLTTTFPSNLSCSYPAPLGSSHQFIVKAHISLAILKEQPQLCTIWLFA